jgi:hypothetical protein
MSKDILEEVVAEMKASLYFEIPLDESKEVAFCAQLLVYVRNIKGDSVKEEYLFSESLTTTARGQDKFRTLWYFIFDKELERAVSMRTDGSLSMTSVHSGFQAFVKQVAPPMPYLPAAYFIDMLWA